MILLIAAGFHKWDIAANSDSLEEVPGIKPEGTLRTDRAKLTIASARAHHVITSTSAHVTTSQRQSFSIRKGFRSRQHHGADRRQIADGITSRQRYATMRALRFYRSQRLHFGSRSPFQSGVKQGTGLLEPLTRSEPPIAIS